MPPSAIDSAALSTALTTAIIEGNKPLVAALTDSRGANHHLREAMQGQTDKIYALDAEVKLLKGVITTLVGDGTGSSGMVPRLERDMNSIGDEVAAVKTEVSAVRSEMKALSDGQTAMREDLKAMRTAQAEQKSWTDGWKGVGVAVAIIGTCISIIGGVVGGLVYLFSHGLKP